MTLAARLRALVDAVPAGGSVTIPRDWLAEQLSAENGEPGSRERDDLARVGPGILPAASTDGSPALLTAREVARRLGCSPRYVYARARSWPFTVRLGERLVRFDAEGLQRWIERAA